MIGADCDHADLIRQDAQASNVPVTTFALHAADGHGTHADFVALPDASSGYLFQEQGKAIGDFSLELEGEFNAANAAAAIALSRAVGVPAGSEAFRALERVHIPGRMEHYESGNMVAYVDYAHNYVSTKTLAEFVTHKYADRNPRVVVVTGSVGDKAVDRREGIIKGAQDYADRIILTAEDTVHERMIDILHEMQGYITNPRVVSDIELDRAKAIEKAVEDAHAHADRLTILLVIGKGEERWIKVDGKHAPYEGDDHVVKRLFGLLND